MVTIDQKKVEMTFEKYTISDIANELGVSRATVSRAINGKDGVSAVSYTHLDVGYCADFLVIPQGDYYWVDDTILDEIVMFKNCLLYTSRCV